MINLNIKKITLIFISVFLLSANIAKAEHDFIELPKPMKAPVSLFENKYQETKTLGNFHGKVTILNLWSSYCKPCIIEMPQLHKIQKHLGESNLVVVPVAQSSNKFSKIRKMFRRLKLIKELEYFRDKDNLTFSSYKVKDVPASFIFNKKGKLVASVSGIINWEKEDNLKFLQKLINEK